MLPYTYMVSWVLDQIEKYGRILKIDTIVLISCSATNYHSIYKLPPPVVKLDDAFMKVFASKRENFEECLREWWYKEDEFKTKTIRLYPIQHFHPAYQDVAVMMCRLFGVKNCNLFRREWTPIMHIVVEEGNIMNWANILVANLLNAIRRRKYAPRGQEPPFYMAAYLLDLVCTAIHFLEIKLQWGSGSPAIHEMFQVMWTNRYPVHFYFICNMIMPQVFQALNGILPSRLSIEARNAIQSPGHWYLEELFTIIRVVGNKVVHYLPWFVPDRLVVREIAFQTAYCGAIACLTKHQKGT